MTLADRRQAEIARYPEAHRHPRYDMKPWRQEILREWLGSHDRTKIQAYMDIGCGKAESLAIGRELRFDSYGCEVVDYLCERDDVDLVHGVHNLWFRDNEFDVTSCNDVLEHVLEEDVPDALREISRVTRHAILLGISRKPGPLHITIKPMQWWVEMIVANVSGTAREVFHDRIPPIKQPYLWVDIQCA